MGYYEHKTKEELLEIVEKLEKKVKGLSSKFDPLKKGRFREWYSTRTLDVLSDTLTVFDHNANIVELASSSATNHVEGTTAENIINSDIRDIASEEAYESVRQNMDKMTRIGKSPIAEHSLTLDGVLHHYGNRISSLDDQYLLCMCHDIPQEAKMARTNEAQRSEIVRLNSLMNNTSNNIPAYLFVEGAGSDFRYLYWNKVSAGCPGISVERAMGNTDAEIFPDRKDAERPRQDDLKTMEPGRIKYPEIYTTMSGEVRTVTTMKTVVPSGGRYPYIIGVPRDVTETKKTEEELIMARTKAEEADWMKSSFSVNMSHEIHTPLNVIVGFSKLIIGADDEYKKWQYADIAEYNSSVLLNLFSDILDLSALEAGLLELFYRPVKLKDICLQLHGSYVKSVKPEARLVLDEVGPQLCIQGDWERIPQILVNLIINTTKFTSAEEIHFGFQEKADMVQFYVSDTGKGIPAERVAMILQCFGKIDDLAQGTGLGLTTCRTLVEKMGGRVWVCSKQGKGTIFYFTLPVKRQ